MQVSSGHRCPKEADEVVSNLQPTQSNFFFEEMTGTLHSARTQIQVYGW